MRLADASLRLCVPGDLFDECDQGLEWETEVGFFTDWPDPPWLVALGQRGFFNEFTVTMSRFAMNVAVADREEFDRQFGVQPIPKGQARSGPPRLCP